MKTKHTPGPWTVVECDNIGATVVSFGDFNGNIELWYHHNSKEESEANAKLIAAAPDLLKACKKALLHHQGGHSEIGFILRGAIDKATK